MGFFALAYAEVGAYAGRQVWAVNTPAAVAAWGQVEAAV